MRSLREPRRTIAGSSLRGLVTLLLLGCTTLRGRADDALERGDYRLAAELYSQLLREKPNDGAIKAHLTTAERGWLDQMLDRAEAQQKTGNPKSALDAGLEALQTKDKVHPEALTAPRPERLTAVIDWARSSIHTSMQADTNRGRALSATARRVGYSPWLLRPELTTTAAEIDAEIKAAGERTCAKSTATAAEQPFALELVASYCKAVGAPLPAWKPRPILVGSVAVEGTIAGTPDAERPEIERAIENALERSVWFTATSSLRATGRVQGTVSAGFRREQVELTRSWTESVPYEATETYQEAVQVPYMDTENYTEQVPYTAFEDRLEPCPPPNGNQQCSVSHRVTRYRTENRQRQVQRYRTEYQDRTRQVTRYRDEPRIFRFPATKQEGRYQAAFSVRVDLGSGVRPIEARVAADNALVAYDHDAEFAPANVHPEHGVLPTALTWRQQQRDKLSAELRSALDAGWAQAFCSESIASIEEAARCAHGRPRPAPNAVRAQVEALFGDDPARVLSLPRPNESVQ